MRRSFRTHGLRHLCPLVCAPGWYAPPRWGDRSTLISRSSRTHSWHPVVSQGCTLGWYAVPRWGGNRIACREWNDMACGSLNDMASWVHRWTARAHSIAPTGLCIPAQSNALGIRVRQSPRSEGTPHIPEWRTCARSTPMRRSSRTHEWHPVVSQGCTLGWYAAPRCGNSRSGLIWIPFTIVQPMVGSILSTIERRVEPYRAACVLPDRLADLTGSGVTHRRQEAEQLPAYEYHFQGRRDGRQPRA